MKYYRVGKELAYKTMFAYNRKRGGTKIIGQFIENELFTSNELSRLGVLENRNNFEVVEIPKSKIYWNFGARFEVTP